MTRLRTKPGPNPKRAEGQRAGAKSAAKPVARKRRRTPAPLRYGTAPPITDDASLIVATAALRALDPTIVGAMLDAAGPPPLRLREPGFAGLAAIVVSQQVSVASADAIRNRLHAAFEPLDAAAVVAATDEALRACGLSGAKVKTLRAIAGAMVSGALDMAALAAMPATEAHKTLVAVHGIGPWSADIFLLFCLGHSDAWPAGDIALQEAARSALGLRTRPDAARLGHIGERWRPYRGVAARILWAYYHVLKSRAGLALA